MSFTPLLKHSNGFRSPSELMTKKDKAISPLQGLHDLVPCSSLCSLLSSNTVHIAVPQTPKALPQGLCTYCSFCLGHSSPRYLYGLLSHLLQIFAQVSLTQWGFPWPPYPKYNHFLPIICFCWALITIWLTIYFTHLSCLLSFSVSSSQNISYLRYDGRDFCLFLQCSILSIWHIVDT